MNKIIKNILTSDIYSIIKKTPLNYANNLSKQYKNNLYFKREDLLPIFSFKLRGAYNKISKLSNEEKKNGIIACSAGNHAQGVAYSCKKLGLESTIIMPRIAPDIKIEAVKNLGANVIIDGDTFDDAKNICLNIVKKENKTLIHPYDDLDVISGQGTIGLELIEQLKDIDYIFCCVGGGGLISGIGTIIKFLSPKTKIIGVEAYDCCAMTQSLIENKIVKLNEIGTYADGAAVKEVGKLNFEISKEVIDEMELVTNNEINSAIISGFKDTRTIFEPAGALGIAGAKKYITKNNIINKNIVIICSGSNIDFKKLRFISDIPENNELFLSITIPEKKGSFYNLYKNIYPNNVTEFSYRTNNTNIANIYMSIQTKNKNKLLNNLNNIYNVDDLSKNNLIKDHIRYLIGGKNIINERLFSFQFPEYPGALKIFLDNLNDKFNVTLFHYRNHGSDIGKVLIGLQCESNNDLDRFLKNLGYKYNDETNNILYHKYLL